MEQDNNSEKLFVLAVPVPMTCFLRLAEMSDTPSAREEAPEEVHLNLLPGSGETQNNNNTNQVITCCNDTHRKLAIWSVICGISCIGIVALINSVKVFSSFIRHLSTAAKSLRQRQTELQALRSERQIAGWCLSPQAVQLFNHSSCSDQPEAWSEGHWPQTMKGEIDPFCSRL